MSGDACLPSCECHDDEVQRTVSGRRRRGSCCGPAPCIIVVVLNKPVSVCMSLCKVPLNPILNGPRG